MKKSILTAVVCACAMVVASCGQGGQQEGGEAAAPEVHTAGSWVTTLSNTTIQANPDGVVTITAANQPAYQAQHEVTTEGAGTLLLRYDVTMQSGPAFLGVLSGDRNTWIANYSLPANVRTQSEAEIPITGDKVYLVFQTSPATAPNAVFTVHSVEYSLR